MRERKSNSRVKNVRRWRTWAWLQEFVELMKRSWNQQARQSIGGNTGVTSARRAPLSLTPPSTPIPQIKRQMTNRARSWAFKTTQRGEQMVESLLSIDYMWPSGLKTITGRQKKHSLSLFPSLHRFCAVYKLLCWWGTGCMVPCSRDWPLTPERLPACTAAIYK